MAPSRPTPATRTLSFELRLARRYLTSGRGMVAAVTATCSLGVFVGVAALVLALALASGLQGDVRQRLLASNPHVVVTPGWGREPWAPDRVRELQRVVEEDPDVVATSPFAREPGLVRSRLVPGGRVTLVLAVDPASEDRVTGLAQRTSAAAWRALAGRGVRQGPVAAAERKEEGGGDGEEGGGDGEEGGGDEEEGGGDEEEEATALVDLVPAQPPPVVLGVDLALSLGVGVGDVVHLVSATPDLTALGPVPRSRALRVAGLLRTGLGEYDQTWAVVALADVDGADGIHAVLAHPLEASATGDRLATRLGPAVQVDDWTTTFSRLFAAFRWEKLILLLALGLIGVVAGFNIFTILTMNVLARVSDIGVLSALGASAGAITRLFVWMGLGLGGAGTLAGVAAGAAGAWLLDHHRLVALDPTVYLVSHVPFDVQAQDLATVVLGMLAVSLLATLVPARVAARLDPVEALRAG